MLLQSGSTEKCKTAFGFRFSEQCLTIDMLMYLPNLFPSVCLRWNEACNRELPPNNWLLVLCSYCYLKNLPLAKHLPYEQISKYRMKWHLNNDPVDCSEAECWQGAASAISVGPPTLEKQLIFQLKTPSFGQRSSIRLPPHRQCRGQPRKQPGEETSWQLI